MKITILLLSKILLVASKLGGDKFKYAYGKLAKRTEKTFEDYNEKLEKLKIEKCSTDERGNIIYEYNGETKSYVYTPQALIELNAAIKSLNEAEVEIEPYLASEGPVGATEEGLELLYDVLVKRPEAKLEVSDGKE